MRAWISSSRLTRSRRLPNSLCHAACRRSAGDDRELALLTLFTASGDSHDLDGLSITSHGRRWPLGPHGIPGCSYLAATIPYLGDRGYMHRGRTTESAALPCGRGGMSRERCRNEGPNPNGSSRLPPVCATLRDTS